MTNDRFKVDSRIKQFLARAGHFNYKSWLLIVYLIAWFMLFFLSTQALATQFGFFIVSVIFAGYVWNKLNQELFAPLEPPSEILLISVLILYSVDILIIRLLELYTSYLEFSIYPSSLVSIFQVVILSLIILLLTRLLFQNSMGKKRIIVYYLILALVGIYFLRLNQHYVWYIYLFFLLFILFRRTVWIEELTKLECWIYFIIFLFLFLTFDPLPYQSQLHANSVDSYIWYYIPKFISHLLNIYFLAILIKIPFVLVYHHATLTRKFKIAGWLQSGLPQLIQMAILSLVFYFFIAGWQAENLRTALVNHLERISLTSGDRPETVYKFEFDESNREVQIPGYASLELGPSFPDLGVIGLQKRGENHLAETDYFLFNLSGEQKNQAFHFMKIDSLFLQELSHNVPLLIANRLLAYPFHITRWDSVLYKLQAWQGIKDYGDIQIFPFALTPHQAEYRKIIPLSVSDQSSENRDDLSQIILLGQNIFTAGRVFLPLYDQPLSRDGYWALDISIIPYLRFFTSPIMQQLVFWLLVYLLINALIIRRVVKFGNQIYQMIIQKFNLLTSGIREISGGNLDYKISMEGRDEFVELAERFNQMGTDLQNKIADLREKDRLAYELNIARQVQLSILPSRLPEVPGYQIAASMQTALEVGGDFYDILPFGDHTYLIVIGDVSGKGTSAAFYMAQCLSLIRFAKQFSDQPREILIRLNRYFSEPNIDRQIFVTGIIGMLDTEKNTIDLYRAGHNHPIFMPADQSLPIGYMETSGLGLGLARKGDIFRRRLRKKTRLLNPGDSLIFYTDGVIEAAKPDHTAHSADKPSRFYDETELKKLLAKLRGESAPDILSAISGELLNFYENDPLIDDFTLLVLKRDPQS